MAPNGGGRKRPRNPNDIGENRASPHRPQASPLAQHEQGRLDMRDGNRRSSRGGQGGNRGRGGMRNDPRGDNNPNSVKVGAGRAPGTPGTPGPMSPPLPPQVQAPMSRLTSANQTPVATPTVIVEVVPSIPKPSSAPFEYAFVTEERIGAWDSTGKQELISLGVQAKLDMDTLDVSSIFQELTRSVLDGRLDGTEAGNCVKDIIGPDTASNDFYPAFDAPTFFLDVFSMIFEAEDEPVFSSLRPFAIATGISPVLMRNKLDAKLLQELGMTQKTFIRQGVRQATNLLYRQANYNLLREEPEGYAKLLSDLFMSPNLEPPTAEYVHESFERVKALIGTFDLDVGRVLDITMDVFAAVLVKHHSFFVKFFRTSSWWPREAKGSASPMRCGGLPKWALPDFPGWRISEADENLEKEKQQQRDTKFWVRAREVGLEAFFELSGGRLLDEEAKKRLLEGSKDDEEDPDREWMEHTGTYPPQGNRVAAQLLGFKLRFYTSDARDKLDTLPDNLIYLTALLIKIGFISLRDLYPHLYPSDEDMPALREKRTREIAEQDRDKRNVGSNALLTAGALSDDTLPRAPAPSSTDKATTKSDGPAKSDSKVENDEVLPEPTEQKVALLKSLLTIGAIPESLFILGRHPWIPEVYPEIVEMINRLISHAIKDVYAACRPLSLETAPLPGKALSSLDQTGVPKGSIRMITPPARKLLKWPKADKYDTTETGQSYRFYFEEWADNVPVCQTVDDLFTFFSTFVTLSGVNVGKDSDLLTKLARIGMKSLMEDHSQHNLDRWQEMLTRVLVPALSLTAANTAIANAIYDMLRFYPIDVRFSIYAEWFQGPMSRRPAMREAFARTTRETNSTMKRISLTNLTMMAKTLSKTAYSSPGVVFSIALSQIESYTNLTEVVVECARYFTDLGYDVLLWSLLNALGGKARKRTNEEFALLPSRWLLALAKFTGKVYRRYQMMNLAPVLQYITYQLYNGNSTDLVILKELIAQMAGIVPDTDFTDSQLYAMTGGEVLRKQTLIMLQDKRYESVKTAKRLIRALTDTSIAAELLISISQHRQTAIYKIDDAEANIKLMATMVDDANSMFFQYLDLLRSNLSPEDFDRLIPGIQELLVDFGIEPPFAFLIGRASIAYRISKLAKPKTNGIAKRASSTEPTITPVDQDGDVGMTNGEGAAVNGAPSADAEAAKDIKMVDVEGEVPAESSTSPEPISEPTDPVREILDPIIESVKTVLPEGSFRGITPEFYVTFWMTVSGDIEAPKPAYDLMMNHWTIENKRLMADRSGDRASMAKNIELATEAQASKSALFTELGKQMGIARASKARLLKNKAYWFESSAKSEVICNNLLEKCLLPRILLSPSDSDYCYKVVKFLHENNVPQFRTLSLYVHLFKANRLRTLFFACSIREAENLARFIKSILMDFARWHADKAVYEKETWGVKKELIGFAKSLDEDGKPKALVDHDGGETGFKPLLLRWHKALNLALRDCLESKEWMHIRNAISVLKTVADVFPAVDFMGKGFVKQLTEVADREQKVREDLSLTANATLVQLKKRASKWVMIQSFGSSMGAAQNGNPKSPSKPKPNLRPSAPEFKPYSQASSLGVAVPQSSATMEVEDGEVDDAKITTPTATATPKATAETKPATSVAPAAEDKKSEVLRRREEMKREQAAAANAPSPPTARGGIPSRPDLTSRNSTLDHSTPTLPTRPEGPFPSRDLIDHHSPRHPDRRDARDSRDSRDTRESRDSRDLRVIDRAGDRPREFPPSDRRGADMNPRDSRSSRDPRVQRDSRDSRDSREFGRPSDPALLARDSRITDPPRWAEPSRENVDRSSSGTRQPETGRLSRDMPPPRSINSNTDRGPPINPERAAAINSDRPDLVNPERAAIISGDKDSRSNSPRRGREEPRERAPSRTQSPRRHGHDKEDSRRDDRPSREGPDHSAPRSRTDEVQPPPAGPRSERGNDRDRSSAGDRAPYAPQLSVPTFMDLDHGRLNGPRGQQADPNFGRLNPAPAFANEAPSGPRGRGSRMPNALAPRHNPRIPVPAEARPPTPERQPPTGPRSEYQSRHSTGNMINVNTSVTTPTHTPPAASPVGVHPDRLKQLPTVHPDRMNSIQAPTQPSPLHQTQNSNSRAPVPSLATSAPSGPRSTQTQMSPNGPSPSNSFGAPTGPARNREPRDNQFAVINNILDPKKPGTGPGGNNIRGRGSRMSGAETPVSAPTTPVIPAPPAFNPNSGGGSGGGRADIIPESAPNDVRDRDRSSRRGGERSSSGRHSTSRRGSRSPAPERGARDERGNRERRDRESERDSRHGGRSSQVEKLIPSSSGGGRDRDGRHGSGRDRESSGRGESGGHAAESGGSWGGDRGAPRNNRDSRGGTGGGDDRRDSRGSRDEGNEQRGTGGGSGSGSGSGRKRISGEEVDPRGGRDHKRARR